MNLSAKVRVAVGTQTEECPTSRARTPAQTPDALPVPPDFQPERKSTPLPAEAMELDEEQLFGVEPSLTDDTTMSFDEQELPAAATDATFHLTAELSFAR